MLARVMIWDPTGATLRGQINTVDLRFSLAAGGGGDLSFTAPADEVDALDAGDSIGVVELDGGAGIVPVAAYAIRPPHTRPRTGKPLVDLRGVGLLEQWASETVLLPEYGGGTIPQGSGEERALGWQGTAYNPATDPAEPWNDCYNTGRSSSSLPTGFPTGTGAKWISVTGASDTSERKLFRATLDLSAQTQPQLLVAYLSADESCTLYVGGEPVAETSSVEMGREEYTRVYMVAFPGKYAVAADTLTDFTKGGDGIDPIIVAVGIVSDSGTTTTWPLVSTATGDVWRACRRDDEFPGEQAPGPTPGKLLGALHKEAKDRGAAFGALTMADLGTVDSYGQPWPAIVVERQHRYGSDTYWSILSALAETNELDVWADWVGPGANLRAAPHQGVDRSSTILQVTHIVTMTDQRAPGIGTWVAGLHHKGWEVGVSSSPHRRETMVELGTARSTAVANRIITAALSDVGRWDGSARVVSATGARPMLDYRPGDTLGCNYPGAPTTVRVLSISAEAGEGGMLWDLELTDGGK